MPNTIDRSKLDNRYLITAKLIMESALHIGGGKYSYAATDSPIVRTPEGLPYIPGSSFKGIFRAQAEKLAHHLGLRTCRLAITKDNDSPQNEIESEVCIPQDESSSKNKCLEDPKYIERRLCDTCKLFGSPYLASKIFFKDLYIFEPQEWSYITQIRDGVMIDRDAERAFPKKKYDFEVVPAGTQFDMYIELENANNNDLALVYAVLLDFKNGFGRIGGKVSRGTGKFTLGVLSIKKVDMNDSEQFLNYLLYGSDGMANVSEDEMKQIITGLVRSGQRGA